MFRINTMKKKRIIYTALLVLTFLISFLFVKGYNIDVDNLFKDNAYYTLFFVVISYLIAKYTEILKNKNIYIAFEIIFIIGFGSGLGILVNNLFYFEKISYIGLLSVFSSLVFLAFVLGRR